MIYLKILFWISLFIVFYTYLGYGILLYVIVKLKRIFGRKKPAPIDFEPHVTLVVSAFNEEDFIDAKIQNTLELNYPREKLDIIFITDGSNDRTPDIVRNYEGIRLLHESERKGKGAAMNRAVHHVKTPVVIFCDANTLLNRDCVKEIAKHYLDESVGGVAGEKVIYTSAKERAASAGEGIYWKYESALKKLDAELYSVVGAAGELFSVRTHLYEPIQEGTIIEDFVLSLKICIRGYIVKYEPNAYAMETGSASMKEEQKRKVRICAGAFQAMGMVRELFNVFKFPVLSFQFISHRILRWTLCPLCLLILLVVNFLIVIQRDGFFYDLFFAAQLSFYALAVVGWIFANKNIRIKALYIPYYVFFMNLSVYLGFSRFLSRKQTVLWEKSNRQKIPQQHSAW
jgi:cellulose synthase/poly-beta-1,6-N-acetylglucosamine synthase-like glycosyltransferase